MKSNSSSFASNVRIIFSMSFREFEKTVFDIGSPHSTNSIENDLGDRHINKTIKE